MKLVMLVEHTIEGDITREIDMKDIQIVDAEGSVTLEHFIDTTYKSFVSLEKKYNDLKDKLEEHDRNISQLYGAV